MPSPIASSFSQDDAFISANPERTTTLTSTPPNRSEARQQSLAAHGEQGAAEDVGGQPQPAGEDRFERDVLAECTPEQLGRTGNDAVQLDAAR